MWKVFSPLRPRQRCNLDTLANSPKEECYSQKPNRTLGHKGGRRFNQVLDLCDQRRQLRQQKHTNIEAGLEYRKVNVISQGKDEGSKGEGESGLEHREGNDVRKQQAALQHSRGSYQDQTQQRKSVVTEDSSGNILTESIIICFEPVD